MATERTEKTLVIEYKEQYDALVSRYEETKRRRADDNHTVNYADVDG